MQELIDAIKAWPVIVQGALGSALFWIFLLVGQKLAMYAAGKYSHISKKARISWLTNEQAKCCASLTQSSEEFATYATIILYRTSRHLIKAAMWLVLGLISQSILSELGIVGFVGSLYYLFKAYEVVAPMNDDKYNQERLDQISAERKRLET